MKNLTEKARKLMSGPGIIFCDEPTGALNAKAASIERFLFLCDGKILNETKSGRFSETELDKRTEKIVQAMRACGV